MTLAVIGVYVWAAVVSLAVIGVLVTMGSDHGVGERVFNICARTVMGCVGAGFIVWLWALVRMGVEEFAK